MRSSRHKCVKRALELRVLATLLVEPNSGCNIFEDVIEDISGVHYVLFSSGTIHPISPHLKTMGLLNLCK